MRRLFMLVPLALLMVGCTTMGGNKDPKLTFKAKPFLKSYMADRDEVIRNTAPAVKKCRLVTSASPENQRLACDLVKQRQDEWLRRDEVVLDALLTGNTVDVDWEKLAEGAAKFIGAAAGVAL